MRYAAAVRKCLFHLLHHLLYHDSGDPYCPFPSPFCLVHYRLEQRIPTRKNITKAVSRFIPVSVTVKAEPPSVSHQQILINQPEILEARRLLHLRASGFLYELFFNSILFSRFLLQMLCA